MKSLRAAACLAIAALSLAQPATAQTFGSTYAALQGQSPCRHWVAVVPSDTVNLAAIPKAIYVGGTGDIAMIGTDAPANATGVTWKAVPTGTLLRVVPRRILATGTTATLMIACL